MCDFSKGFILCKCNDPKVVVHNKKSRIHKNNQSIEYHWTLFKFLDMAEEREMGKYLFPINDIGHGLTADFVLNELNSGNCFDFEYQPSEGDNLSINKTDSATRIEFIYKNGKWEEDHYSPFDYKKEKFDNGKVKEI